jgi:hypothetical protein
MHVIDLNKIDLDSCQGQKLRRELLLQLKDRDGLKHREFAKLSKSPVFSLSVTDYCLPSSVFLFSSTDD